MVITIKYFKFALNPAAGEIEWQFNEGLMPTTKQSILGSQL